MTLAPTGAWMVPAEVMAWIAFHDPRPLAEWHAFTDDKLCRPWLEWGFPHGIVGMVDQAQLLLSGLKARADGRVWRVRNAEVFGGGRAYPFRAQVRRLMRLHGTTAATLAANLEHDILTETSVQAALDRARTEMVDAVRNERLPAIGHRAKTDGASAPSAVPEKIGGALFLGPRTIDVDGWVREDSERPTAEWSGYHGPYFDRVHFRTVDVTVLWPANPSDNGETPDGGLIVTRVGVRTMAKEGSILESAPAAAVPATGSSKTTAPRRLSGRNYAVSDAPLVREIKEMVDTGRSRTPWDAALALAERAEGYGDGISKAKRLVGRYSVVFRAERG